MAEKPFSLPLFVITVSISLIGVLMLLRIAAPQIWQAQFQASWWVFLLTFLALHLKNAFVEYGFHRYVLHQPLIPGLRSLYKKHTKHHALTRIVMRKPNTRVNPTDKPVSENFYPILEEKQHESSFFPWYTYLAFASICTVLYLPLQLLWPHTPFLLAGYLSLAWSLMLYEILHAIEHLDFDKWWLPLVKNKRWGKTWIKIYGFHLRHHASIDSNESISGFFGFPLPDLLFGTWVSPQTLFTHNKEIDPKEFLPPRPVWIIRWLDSLVVKTVKGS